MKKVAFQNLGCKVNEYEMEFMQQIMSQNGYEIVPFDTKADIYIVNTCTVTNIADRKSRQMLHRAKKRNPEAIVVAAGCYVQTDTEGSKNDEAVDIVIGNNKKSMLPEIIEQYIKNHKISEDTVLDLTHVSEYEDMHITHTQEHTRAFIKIQDGCNQFCSYCAIPLSRGRIRSRNEESILREVENLANNGYAEVVITGIHLSSYGIDIDNRLNGTNYSYNDLAKEEGYTNERLLDIIKKVSNIKGIERIRLGSLEPRLITDEFLENLSKIEKLCPHFHLSLQSGCDETLKRMNRKYTSEEYLKSVELLRKYFDNPAITTDIIVGFPGETDEEFMITMNFVRKVSFFEIHVFKYSKRSGTVAATMKNQIKDEIKDERSSRLIALSKELENEYKELMKGRESEVLFEEMSDGVCIGHTREYLKVGMRTEEDLSNVILKKPIDGDTLFFI